MTDRRGSMRGVLRALRIQRSNLGYLWNLRGTWSSGEIWVPLRITMRTSKRVYFTDGRTEFSVPLAELDAEGKAWWARRKTWMYTETGACAAFGPYWRRGNPRPARGSETAQALQLLGLSFPCTAEEVNRAFRRVARRAHPDAGGTHEAFVALQSVRDIALSAVSRLT